MSAEFALTKNGRALHQLSDAVHVVLTDTPGGAHTSVIVLWSGPHAQLDSMLAEFAW